jgi:hypothetical protein
MPQNVDTNMDTLVTLVVVCRGSWGTGVARAKGFKSTDTAGIS